MQYRKCVNLSQWQVFMMSIGCMDMQPGQWVKYKGLQYRYMRSATDRKGEYLPWQKGYAMEDYAIVSLTNFGGLVKWSTAIATVMWAMALLF